jgi:hypothetical protein
VNKSFPNYEGFARRKNMSRCGDRTRKKGWASRTGNPFDYQSANCILLKM